MTIAKPASPLRHLLTGAGAQFIALIISAVIGFMLTPYMIRTLGNRDYGIMILVGTFTGWFGLMDLGLSGAVSRYISVSYAKGDAEGCNAYANSALFMYMGLGLCGLVLAAIAALIAPLVLASEQDSFVVPILIVLSGVAFAIDLPLRALSGLINGCMRQDRTSALQLLGRVARAGTTVGVIALGGRLISLSVTGVVVTAFLALTWWWAARRTLPAFEVSRKHLCKARSRSLLSFGGIAFIGRIAETFLFRLDGFLIAYFLAVAFVAHFNVATTLVAYYEMTMVAFTGWLLQWFAFKTIGRGEEATESLFMATRYSVYIGGFCMFGLIAWGDPFIRRWMGEEYLDAYPCLVVLAIAMFLRGAQMPYRKLLFARAQHHFFAVANVIEGIVNVAVSVVLVHRYGLIGIAVGTMVASGIVNGVLFPVVCCKLNSISVTQYYGMFLRAVFVAILGALIPCLLTNAYVEAEYGRLLLLGAVSAVLYFTLVVALGSSRSERRRVWAACCG